MLTRPRPFVPGGGDGAESHDLLAAGCWRRCQLAAGGGGGRDEGTGEDGVLSLLMGGHIFSQIKI